MDIPVNTGFLEIIQGPMKSGKTSRLITLYKQFTFCNIPVMIINNQRDDRYSITHLSTHDLVTVPCLNAMSLSDIVSFSDTGITGPNRDSFINTKIILINEAQFFEDIVEWVTLAVEKYNKSVYVCGLNSDYRRLPFGNWLDLERICDKITHLTALCGNCRERVALFSYRKSEETEVIIIGNENYIPVCRRCWISLDSK
jgi:thymidine kinase